MDGFSLVVLENTLDSVAELTQREEGSPILDCVTEVRGYAELCALHPADGRYSHQLRQAMTNLAGMVQEKREFILAVRLEMIAQQLCTGRRLPPSKHQ